ncbi:MAG: hypothetical protein ACTSR2_07735 [Candidatus Hodarchaeales archaeon]
MVSFGEVIFGNIFSIIIAALVFGILVVSYLFYSKTKHTGFLVIMIGNSISILWSLFYIFVLQGMYFSMNLTLSGMSTQEVASSVFLVSSIGFGVNFVSTALLLLGIILFGSSLPQVKRRY